MAHAVVPSPFRAVFKPENNATVAPFIDVIPEPDHRARYSRWPQRGEGGVGPLPTCLHHDMTPLQSGMPGACR